MSDLTESDILQRHSQSLKEASATCQRLGRNADPEYIAPRGRDYVELKKQLDLLEGSARQMAHFRQDARWLKLGILYARVKRGAQAKFVGQNWLWFRQLMPLFENGLRSMEELRTRKTGSLSSSPILPARASDWLVLPDHRVPQPYRGKLN